MSGNVTGNHFLTVLCSTDITFLWMYSRYSKQPFQATLLAEKRKVTQGQIM